MNTKQILKSLYSLSGIGITILILALCGLVLIPSIAHAESGTPPPNNTPKNQKADDRLAKAFQQEQDRLQKQSDNLNKANGAVSKLQGVIVKAKGKGLDTSSLEQALTAFKSSLANAQTGHDKAASILSTHNGFDANGAVTDIDAARQTVANAHQSLADTRNVLKQAVQDLHAIFKAWREENKGKGQNEALAKPYQRQQDWLKKQADHLLKTDEVVTKVQALIQRAKDQNLNTASLEQALSVFQSQIVTAQKSHAATASILATHTGFDGNGAVTESDAARITVRDAHQSLMDARTVLKQAGQDLRSAIKTWREANILQSTALPTVTP